MGAWPVFNVADAALLIGVALFVLGSALGDGEPEGEAVPDA